MTSAASKSGSLDDAAGYNSGTFYDPDSPSLGAWLELLPADIKSQGLGVAHLKQNNTHRVPGFLTQGPEPISGLDKFRAAVVKPPQPAVKLTHRYQLSQQAPKVLLRSSLELEAYGIAAECGSCLERNSIAVERLAPRRDPSCASSGGLSRPGLAARLPPV